MEALPPELLAGIAAACDAAAAGLLAQASKAWKMLLRVHLDELHAELLEAQRRREADAAALELQQAFASRAAPALLDLNDMGGGRLALRVASRDSPMRASTTRFTCECCGFQGGRACGYGFANVQRHLASKSHWTAHRLRVHNLPFDTAAWHAFVLHLP
jgi:hypothetical protein